MEKTFFESQKRWTFQLNHMFTILLVLNQLILIFATTPADVQQFEQSLKQRDYKQALLKFDQIKSEKNSIEEVIKNVYKETTNIDTLLYFTSSIIDINERAAIYDLIFNTIIKDGGTTLYSENTDRIRIQALYSCNTMKYVEKIENTILKLLDNNSELYRKTLNHVENLKNEMSEKMMNELRGLNHEMANFTTIKYKATSENLKCMLLILNTNTIVKQYEMILNNTETDEIDCSLTVTDGTNDIEIVKQMLAAQNQLDKFKQHFSYKYNFDFSETKDFENALIDKDFNSALLKLNSLNNDSLSSIVIKKLYRQFYNLEDLLYFASLVTNKNDGNLNVIKSVIEAVFDNDKFSVCEAIKVIDILQKLRFKQQQHEALIQFTNDIKLNLTNAIKQYEENIIYQSLKLPKENPDTFSIKINKSYAVDVYDKTGELQLGRIEYMLKRMDNETLCYYRGSVSITNYDYWYMKNYLIVVNWFTFIVLVTKFC